MSRTAKVVIVLALIYAAIACIGIVNDVRLGMACAKSGGVFVHDTAHRPLCINPDAATEGELP